MASGRDGVRFGWLVTQSQRVVAHHRDLVIRLSRRQRHCASQLLGHNARLLLVTLLLPGFASPKPSVLDLLSTGSSIVVHDLHPRAGPDREDFVALHDADVDEDDLASLRPNRTS